MIDYELYSEYSKSLSFLNSEDITKKIHFITILDYPDIDYPNIYYRHPSEYMYIMDIPESVLTLNKICII